ncbi:hypothetical protein [Alkalimarinus coralli]|uniref:hypothetical protein n=1 Tax=Alkalimarinus coralli TaxID=2935863 RepID=UPI00202AF63D|nr:hypothetical protein [Alkalimarinus coralli]
MRAIFEAKDPEYRGIERRMSHRRVLEERRTSVRFEPEKIDRRQLLGRRAQDGDSWLQRDF